MRDLSGIIKDNEQFNYRQAAIRAQNALADAQSLLRYLGKSIDQEIASPGSVEWTGVRDQVWADKDAL